MTRSRMDMALTEPREASSSFLWVLLVAAFLGVATGAVTLWLSVTTARPGVAVGVAVGSVVVSLALGAIAIRGLWRKSKLRD